MNSTDHGTDDVRPDVVLVNEIVPQILLQDANGNVIVGANHMITPKRAQAIEEAGIESVKIRTILATMNAMSQEAITCTYLSPVKPQSHSLILFSIPRESL